MHQIETQIDIAASSATVWSILMDFPAYPQWNPFVRSISGEAILGKRLRASIQPEGRTAMTFRPNVSVVKEQEELRWLGHMILPGIFDGEHYFQLNCLANGQTRFTQGEKFSGLLVGLFVSQLEGATRAGFSAMNAALKSRAEGSVSADLTPSRPSGVSS
ncbi:SRPBCC domain-containing protein [Acidithiobacillus sp. VAN18-1]|uniref:SRPBCC domain-containing protein n=1 Tax=Igneacidithiobacillus copahuensis TaxID=2724909 RepID=A0AAE2YQ15_9PROT|nr:SRPBCC domain-containing protein [Igneacidithiobacillus copahuensis]MBU2787890.1 SRPBCC domain-containing protein [Igneacidithiobacillus copahuensis]MBU2795506.1 SRPBCC domain-containing protein [Acidithiobacillus sp. VAN18-2]